MAAVLCGWWYVRNEVNTGTLSGLAEPVMLHGRSLSSLVEGARHLSWLHGIDVTLLSHIYFCGWSGLTLRSWMYHVFFLIAILAALGVLRHLRRPPVLWLIGVYAFFWVGELYNIWLQYLTKNLTGSMGWYMYAVIVPEIVLCALAAPARFRSWALAIVTMLFAILDLFAMHWIAIPYYIGLTAHRPNSEALTALHFGAYRTLGFSGIFDRLAVNQWAPIGPGVLTAAWSLYIVATMLLAAISRSPGMEARASGRVLAQRLA